MSTAPSAERVKGLVQVWRIRCENNGNPYYFDDLESQAQQSLNEEEVHEMQDVIEILRMPKVQRSLLEKILVCDRCGISAHLPCFCGEDHQHFTEQEREDNKKYTLLWRLFVKSHNGIKTDTGYNITKTGLFMANQSPEERKNSCEFATKCANSKLILSKMILESRRVTRVTFCL